ncbi:uncharacterized protein LOC129136850 [Pan troglodytes]|uniref:uncharacterized protein LOC129136850 n=1 Tax=Pan troglodytes TaxID=9598 RepID=UPI0023F57512|nr:uncharacterized protein LOC129136850 [Pan troglodytes]
MLATPASSSNSLGSPYTLWKLCSFTLHNKSCCCSLFGSVPSLKAVTLTAKVRGSILEISKTTNPLAGTNSGHILGAPLGYCHVMGNTQASTGSPLKCILSHWDQFDLQILKNRIYKIPPMVTRKQHTIKTNEVLPKHHLLQGRRPVRSHYKLFLLPTVPQMAPKAQMGFKMESVLLQYDLLFNKEAKVLTAEWDCCEKEPCKLT